MIVFRLSWLENSSSEFLTNVTALWNQMGLSHDGLAHRHDTVRSVIKKMYGDLITEEEMHIKKVIDSIEKHGKESAKLAKVS